MPVFTPELIARYAQTVEADPAPKRSHGPMHVTLGAMAAGQIADTLTTLAALKREGTHEANAVYGSHPSAARIVATKAAIGVPSALALDKLYDTHPKLAMSLAAGLGGLGLALAAHNSGAGR